MWPLDGVFGIVPTYQNHARRRRKPEEEDDDESSLLPVSGGEHWAESSAVMADTCGQIVLGTGLTVLSHPLMYIKVLVQVRQRG